MADNRKNCPMDEGVNHADGNIAVKEFIHRYTKKEFTHCSHLTVNVYFIIEPFPRVAIMALYFFTPLHRQQGWRGRPVGDCHTNLTSFG
jgi:hypothetical protein